MSTARGGRPIRTVLFSTLYPSSARPGHALFVETRLRELLRTGRVEAKVLAPVPWFPSGAARFGRYASLARTPPAEVRHGIDVRHPRYLAIPKLGMSVAPLLLAAASIAPLKRLVREGFDFDLIDAHYYYPDGVAAVMLARWFGKPVTVTARGSDLNLIPRHLIPRLLIRQAAARADASVGVSQALVDVLRGWGIDPKRLHVMRNGVDLQRFRPLPQDEARRSLGLRGSPLLLSVGNLIELKGHHLVIDALPLLSSRYPDVHLAIVGEGPDRAALERRARNRGVARAVRFAGPVPNDQLARWYSAADALVLASQREGWANVLLEAMACGTPVLATRVGGNAEVVADSAGLLLEQRSAPAIADGIVDLVERALPRAGVRAYAECFDWDETSRGQADLFCQLLAQGRE
jgi:teichuronic acid biosynthesis glycosyltransferase TuaC